MLGSSIATLGSLGLYDALLAVHDVPSVLVPGNVGIKLANPRISMSTRIDQELDSTMQARRNVQSRMCEQVGQVNVAMQAEQHLWQTSASLGDYLCCADMFLAAG